MKYFWVLLFLVVTISVAQDGSPDVLFGNDGLVLKSYGESSLDISSVSQGESGRIAVLATEYPVLIDTLPFILVFNEDGTIDTTFGDNGVIAISSFSGAPVTRINVLNDNSILYGFGDSVIKLLPSGQRDLSFGDEGSIVMDYTAVSGLNYSLRADGSIYLYGITYGGDREFIITKYLSDGIIDTSFGQQGIAQFLLGPFIGFYEKPIRFLDNERLLVNYSLKENSTSDFINYVTRINQNGDIDSSFGTNGNIEINFNGKANSNIHVLNTGGFFISYVYNVNGGVNRKTQRYLPNGNQDNNFADNGILDGHSVAFIQENQRLITIDSSPDSNGGTQPSLNRFFPAGAIDNSFDFQYDNNDLGSFRVSPTPDGKILLAGDDLFVNGQETNLVVARFNNSPLGVDENELSTLTVYPNPSTNLFYISSEKSLYGKNYLLYNTLGQIISKDVCKQERLKLNLNNYPSGVYFLTINSNTFKLIKK